MLTVGELRKLIKVLPDEALIIKDDPYSEFSYNILGAERSKTKISHITNDGEIFYESWTESNFEDLLSDNEEEKDEIIKEYKPSLLLYVGE